MFATSQIVNLIILILCDDTLHILGNPIVKYEIYVFEQHSKYGKEFMGKLYLRP